MSSTRRNKVQLASLAGFCYGVRRAVDLCVKVKENNPHKDVYVLGQLIHNNQAIEYLEKRGIKTIDSVEEAPTGSICVIRSHGEGPQVLQQLEERGIEIVDATCPDVKRVQDTAATLAQEGYKVIIIGQSAHPEVVAIKDHVNHQGSQQALVISSVEDIETHKEALKSAKKIGVVTQTTQTVEKFKDLLSKLAEITYEIKAFNTICNATSSRQKQARNLSKDVDLMIVVGSKKSANTTHLADICREINPNTIHIENFDSLKGVELTSYGTIGVTAGASTPAFVIDDVIKYINEQ